MKDFLGMHIRLHCGVADTGRFNLYAEPQKNKMPQFSATVPLVYAQMASTRIPTSKAYLEAFLLAQIHSRGFSISSPVVVGTCQVPSSDSYTKHQQINDYYNNNNQTF
jgi:hypothetical protein